MEFRLRRCSQGDELALSLIAQATILETYAGIADGADLYAYVTKALSVESFRELLAGGRARAWIVETEVGSGAVGYSLLLLGEDPAPFSEIELERFYLLYRFHGLGLGKRMMDEVLTYARANGTSRLALRVNSQNATAIAFYEQYGFRTITEEPFRAGERDYRVFVMQLSL